MTHKTSYLEKLRDPRWQRKRLEVLEWNDFTCELCGDSESPLHVHHKAYFKGQEPWEYDRNQLACLCESCHESQHGENDLLKDVTSRLSLDGPGSRNEAAYLLAGFSGIPIEEPEYHYHQTLIDLGRLVRERGYQTSCANRDRDANDGSN